MSVTELARRFFGCVVFFVFFLLQGVLDRFTQIKPKVIFSVEAVQYNGRKHDHLTKLRSVVEGLPDLTRVVIQPFCCEGLSVDISSVPKRYIYMRSNVSVQVVFFLPFEIDPCCPLPD